MTFRSFPFGISAIVISSIFACKTVPRSAPEAPKSETIQAAAEPEPTPITPSSANLKGPTDLVTPGPDEVLVRRGANARCPNTGELDRLDQTVAQLGKDTVDLVKEDLVNLRQTATRSDKDSIGSCCNQLEQLVQDAEIMNDDKEQAVANLDRIRKITLALCPPG